jgi:thiol-disulfide isomerase/thioredoxin
MAATQLRLFRRARQWHPTTMIAEAFLLAFLCCLAGCREGLPGTSADEAIGSKHPGVGTKLDVLRLQPLTGDGQPVSMRDLEGKVTLINYWGPWCGYCEVEFPHLIELVEHFKSNPEFKFLSVSCPSSPDRNDKLAAETTDFLARLKASFPTYTDDDAVSRRHLVEASKVGEDGFGYPATVILDREGTIRGMWVGYVPGWEKQMRRIVDEQLAEKAK